MFNVSTNKQHAYSSVVSGGSRTYLTNRIRYQKKFRKYKFLTISYLLLVSDLLIFLKTTERTGAR